MDIKDNDNYSSYLNDLIEDNKYIQKTIFKYKKTHNIISNNNADLVLQILKECIFDILQKETKESYNKQVYEQFIFF
jgi:hypothetical protein